MPTRPNIVLCMCDELRAFEVGCYGNPTIRTPNIDRLAGQGVRVETAVSNNPVCMPARSIVLSGQYSRTCCGTLGNTALQLKEGGGIMPQYPSAGRPQLRDTTLPEQLRAQGYRTAAIGKWHIESWPDDVGFDQYVIPRVHHCHTAQNFIEDGGREFSPPGYSVDYEADRVREFLSADDGAAPFFLYYNISPPHMPLDDAPEHYRTMYSEDEVVLRDNVADPSRPVEDQERRFRTYLWDFRYYRDHLPYTRTLPAGFNLRRLIAMYYGLTTWVDDTVGKLLAALDEADRARDTIVVFTSDHGDNLGSHGRMGKNTLNEESIRIPLIFRWPEKLPPAVIKRQVVSLMDLAPTLLQLAGIDPPATMQGRSAARVLRGEVEALSENYAIIETGGDGAGIRTPTRLLALPWGDDQHGFGAAPHYHHDLTNDPYQLRPLPGTDNELEAILRRWLRDTPWL